MVLEFLLRHAARTGSARSREIVAITCERMARGGMYDQLGGGFARYSVDAEWVVPHFEKMLYDNALLARVYAHWWRLTGIAARRDGSRSRPATGWSPTCCTDAGGFASSLDADTEGHEGQVLRLDARRGRAGAAEIFGVTEQRDVRARHVGAAAARRPGRRGGVRRRAGAAARAARASGSRPARDDKVVAAWNGLAIAALAEVGVLFDRPDLVDGATALRRAARPTCTSSTAGCAGCPEDGVVGEPAGVLEDYGDVAEGLLALHQVTGERRWLDLASELLDVALAQFGDGGGGFFDTADDAQQLVRRPQDPTDGATPAGFSAVAAALLTSAALTGRADHRDAATAALGAVGAARRAVPSVRRLVGRGVRRRWSPVRSRSPSSTRPSWPPSRGWRPRRARSSSPAATRRCSRPSRRCGVRLSGFRLRRPDRPTPDAFWRVGCASAASDMTA